MQGLLPPQEELIAEFTASVSMQMHFPWHRTDRVFRGLGCSSNPPLFRQKLTFRLLVSRSQKSLMPRTGHILARIPPAPGLPHSLDVSHSLTSRGRQLFLRRGAVKRSSKSWTCETMSSVEQPKSTSSSQSSTTKALPTPTFLPHSPRNRLYPQKKVCHHAITLVYI
jgi:hypothetical protein